MGGMYRALHRAFHDPSAPAFKRLERVILSLIIASVVLTIVELSLAGREPISSILRRVDIALMAFFAVELILRVASYHPPELDVLTGSAPYRIRWHVLSRLRFLFTPMILIDLMAVIAIVPALRGLRILRLLRLLRGVKLLRHSSPALGVARAFQENALLYAFNISVLLTVVNLGGISMYLVEHGTNPGLQRIQDGIWWAMVTVTTVGFGDVTPVTPVGRLIAGTVMISGMFILALFAGTVGATLVRALVTLREDTFRMTGFTDHIVVCGYDPAANLLLDSLRKELGEGGAPIVVFAPGDRPLDLPSEYLWMGGDATREGELDKVRLSYARTAIVIGSRTSTIEQSDARTILVVFTIRSFLARDPTARSRQEALHVIAEILDPENRAHAVTAGADEVVETTRFSFDLIAHAALVPGSGDIVSRVVAAGASSLFIESNPVDVPMPYEELARILRHDRGVAIIGIRDTADEMFLNPPGSRMVQPDEELIYLAERACLSAGTPNSGQAPSA